MISIYDSNNEDYNYNGDAILMPSECIFNATINGAWVVTLTHPYDAKERYKHIVEGAVIGIRDIKAVDGLSNKTLYRIASVKKGIDSVVATAYPIAMDSTFDVPIASFTESGTGILIGIALDELTEKYDIYVESNSITRNVHFEDTNLNQVMGGDSNSMLTIFGGELFYNNFHLDLYEHLGNQNEDDRHVIRYGKNLNNIDYNRDESGVITRIYPISTDGIKLNGLGYVDSSHISDYPFVRAKYLSAPYQLVDTSKGSTTNTATLTASIATQVKNTAETLSHTIYNTAVTARTFEREYLKENRDEITEAVQELCLQGISHEGLYSVIEKAIADGMKWMKDIQKLSWTWHEGQNGWWYGTDNSDYAKSQWCYIDKKWRWFDSDGYWVEKWDDASGDWDWIQSQSNAHWWYGNNSRYYAHNEWIYQTNDGVFKKYWIDEQGWYQPDLTEESDWVWHTWGDGWWFGEEGASTSEPSKFAHDMWVWIDGNYYFFDSTGYYDGTTKIDNYAWDWQEDNGWYWFGNRDKSFGSQWLYSQWSKIDNKWYRFDANGYMADDKPLLDECLAMYRTGMADLKTLCGTLKNEAYALLYTNMTAWCNKRYSEGLDMPTVTINLDMIDLSKSLEYYKKGYSWLEDVQLGDKVRCEDREHDIYTYERVVGITYDCIRKINTQITIGVPDSTVAEKLGVANGSPQPTGGYDMSIIEGEIDNIQDDIASLQTNKQNKLIAGQNITITSGNVISATGGGGGADVEVNPSGSATAIMKKLRVDSTIYGLPYKELTQEEYDDLPDTKLSDDVVYFIKPYIDITVVDNQLIIREFNDGTVIWYFNGYHWIDDGAGDIIIPSEIAEKYLPPCPFEPVSPQTSYYVDVTASYYADPTHPELYGEREGWIGFRYNYPTLNDVYVMSYTLSYSSSNNGIFNGRYIMGGSESTSEHGAEQETEYIPPEEDEYIPRDAKAKIILNGNEYIGGGGGSKSEIVELLQSEYDALSSDKKNNGDLYMVYDEPQLDPDYNYYKWGDNDEIVVRVYHEGESDEEIRWYFHNYSQQATLLPIPSELSEYWSGTNTAKAYTPNTTTVYGWMAISDYQGGARGIYSTSWSTYQEGPIDAMIVMGDGAEQDTTYSDPYVYINQNPISRKIYLHEREYTHKVTANPSGTPTTNLSKLEVDGTIYSIPSGGGGGGGSTTTYYVTDGYLSDGTNHQFITVQLDTPLTEGRGYVICFKNVADGQILSKSFFDYLNDYTITMYAGTSIGNITLNITSNSISSNYYSGAWQDIYIDVYQKVEGGGGASYYLHDGLIGSSGGSYVTCNLDNMMDAGTYLVTIRDASTNNGLITSYFIEWRNETINLPVAMGTLTITDSTAGLSYYSGNYRDIYCNIIKII